MTLRNYTPFAPLFFESRDQEGRQFGVLVLRGTFKIIPNAALKPDPDQKPIVEADVYHGEVGKSSVRMESDLAPFKPRADIHINAVACAPGGRPASSWLVDVQIGKLRKQLKVTGRRFWSHSMLSGWKLSSPELCAEVPLRYEHAYGGIFKHEEDEEVFEQNPVGVGFALAKKADRDAPILAPQIESPAEPITSLDQTPAPQGLGVIAKAWLPRRKLAGTYDEKWKKERWPELPADFNFAYYNSAHPDLIYPGYLKGDERIQLEGLRPNGALRFALPAYRVFLLLRFRDGMMMPAPLFLDTLLIDVPENKAYLTWRFALGLEQPLRVIEARLSTAKE